MLSVIIITKNEAHNIQRCLESVSWADEIIVYDSGSTDSTLEIAKRYTDKVFQSEWSGYGIQKQRALNAASGDWVLNLDADESVSPALKKMIQKVTVEASFDAWRIPIRMCFYDKILRYSSSPKRHIRLFKRKDASYSSDIVHEKIVLPLTSRVAQMKEPIIHHSFVDLSHALYKLNRYSSYTAKIRLKQTSRPRFSLILMASFWMFFRTYILQRGFLDGKAGFILAFYHAEGAFYRGMKQLYPDRTLDELPEVEDKRFS